MLDLGAGPFQLAEMQAWPAERTIRARLNAVNDDGNAVFADRLKVGGHVLLNEEFTAAGAIWLGDAEIAGVLQLLRRQADRR